MTKTYGDDYNSGYDKFKKAGMVTSLLGMAVGGIGEMLTQKNRQKAQEIMDAAQDRYSLALEDFNHVVTLTRDTVISVVGIKKQIMRKNMKKFIKAYKRLSPKIMLQDSQGLYELRRFALSPQEFDDIERERKAYLSYNEENLGNKAFNVALLMVQDGRVANLAEQMGMCLMAEKLDDEELARSNVDNTKIQSIGAIAQVSTLAIGYGISGLANAFSSASSIDDAREFDAKCTEEIEKLKLNKVKIEAICEYADIHLKLLERLNPLINEYVDRAVRIVKKRDNLLRLGRIKKEKFTQEELEVLAFTLSLVGAVKVVIDSPIISQEGEVYEDENSDFKNAQESVETLEQKCIEMRA